MPQSEYARQIKQIKRHRTKVVLSTATKAYNLHRKKQDSDMHHLIASEFTRLGGVYVKFLQGVLLRSSLMKNWRSPDRLKIFEDLETEPLNIQSILISELGENKLAEITAISPEPFAAGSFGQVYYGQHKDGTPIVVKVLRPMIRETLIFDLKLLGMFIKTFMGKARNMQLDIKQAVDDFKKATLRETDYVAEAQFADELYQSYKDHPSFVIPKTYMNLCTPSLIVQEYLPGVSVAQLLKFQEQGVDIHSYVKENFQSDVNEQLITAGEELIYGIFALPRIQGDPHPGNIKILPGGKVGMIDFGISAKSPNEKAAFYALLREYTRLLRGDVDIPALFGQFLRFFVSDLYRSLKKITSVMPQKNTEQDLTRQMGSIAEKNFKKEMGNNDLNNLIENGNIVTLVNRVVNKGNRFGIVMKLDDSEMLRAAQSYMTLVESMGGKTTTLPTIMDRALDRVARDFPEYTQDSPDLPSVNRAMETISKWLERVAEKDPALFRSFVSKINFESKTKPPKPTASEKKPAKTKDSSSEKSSKSPST